jgi:muramidase (phage lysozyme)
MDRTVPRGAAILLDYIGKVEVGREGRDGYDVVYGHNQARLRKPLTQMTVDEVIAAGPSWTRAWRSSAAGRYQFMNATLKGLKIELRLRGTQVFDPDLQDRLGHHLLKRRGYAAFMAGQISRTEFGRRLAMEWASFPVLADTRGAHQNIKRGQSYYAGDALNRALVAPAAIEKLLDEAKAAGTATTLPPPAKSPSPVPTPSTPATGGFWAALASFFRNLFSRG